jgi:hypothetical protein
LPFDEDFGGVTVASRRFRDASWSLHPAFAKIGNEIVALVEQR